MTPCILGGKLQPSEYEIYIYVQRTRRYIYDADNSLKAQNKARIVECISVEVSRNNSYLHL